MTIYILDSDQKKCAEMLDDKSLARMIRDVAQVLCDVHIMTNGKSLYENLKENTFLKIAISINKISTCLIYSHSIKSTNGYKCSKWARECKANYLYLVELGWTCCEEYFYRFCHNKEDLIKFRYWDKYRLIILWARDNVPDLPCKEDFHPYGYLPHKVIFHDNLPLVMPKKFQKLSHFNPENWHQSDHIDNIVYAYRNYYQANLRRKQVCFTKWTNREKPEWISL